MATASQVRANRENAKRSSGPRRTDVTRFNGLKHGLRAEEVVLPGEDPAEFEAERRAWLDDWRPQSHTRAVLVERAAVASWRLRRCVRSEAALRRRRGEEAARDFDAEVADRVERTLDRFEDDPGAALSLLESHAAGIDRLLKSWGELAEALERGPSGWDQPKFHTRLMLLLGHPIGTAAGMAGPAPLASLRLAAVNDPTRRVAPMPASEAEAAVATLRRAAAEALSRLRELRGRAPDPGRLRALAVEAAGADTSKGAQLQHRYEMAHEKSLRWALRELVALEKSGADLPEPPEDGPDPIPEAVAEAVAAPAGPEAPEESVATNSISNSCAELASVGAAASTGERPGSSSGSPGRPDRPIGVDPGPETASIRR